LGTYVRIAPRLDTLCISPHRVLPDLPALTSLLSHTRLDDPCLALTDVARIGAAQVSAEYGCLWIDGIGIVDARAGKEAADTKTMTEAARAETTESASAREYDRSPASWDGIMEIYELQAQSEKEHGDKAHSRMAWPTVDIDANPFAPLAPLQRTAFDRRFAASFISH
jgi:hypothetical protein